jgi:Cof subfamily protein (haloacid dehalogenase superfamily)
MFEELKMEIEKTCCRERRSISICIIQELIMKYSNIILFSDLDGTLLDSQLEVSKENREAIEKFVSGGGRFGVATGRGIENALGFLEGIPFNYYSIFLNGALLQDMRVNKKVDLSYLNKEKIIPLVKKVLKKYPTIGIQVYLEGDLMEGGAYFVSSKESTPNKVVQGHLDYGFIEVEDIENRKWLKLFFYGEPEELKLVEEDSKNLVEEGVVDDIYTTINYYELLPKGCNKGKMIKKIQGLKNEGDKIYVVGDYYNDVEMMKEADIGIYTENAPDDLKETVEFISTNCNNSAIADVIYRIIDMNI